MPRGRKFERKNKIICEQFYRVVRSPVSIHFPGVRALFVWSQIAASALAVTVESDTEWRRGKQEEEKGHG